MNISYQNLYDYCNVSSIESVKSQYFELLRMLTDAPDVPTDIFLENLERIHHIGSIVICLDGGNRIVGCGTVIIEPKMIHGGRAVGHIEDLVIHHEYRGLGIARGILNRLVELSDRNNCYKVILDCSDELVCFYSKLDFEKRGEQMAYYF
jgi:glucosamine-phosphate N-acetyltransferase